MISLDFIDAIFHFLATSLMGKIIEEDLWLIKNLRVEKQWGARRMMKMWPPNSPDLNPVDYAIWGALQQRVYTHKPRNVEELQQAILEEWDRLSQNLITASIDQWRKRLLQVVNNGGGHIEHLF